jgi:hypothetical protein
VNFQADNITWGQNAGRGNKTSLDEPLCTTPREQGFVMVQIFTLNQTIVIKNLGFHRSPWVYPVG